MMYDTANCAFSQQKQDIEELKVEFKVLWH